jgi:uncharacterized membrane protein YhaH (DUF805 family)
MKCPNCGKEIPNDSNYCEYCGRHVKSIMNFGKAISTCLSKYATFSGRASRSEYWWFWLFCIILYYGGIFLDMLLLGRPLVFTLLTSWPFLLPQISAGVRRCHDSGHSGWWVICPLVNFIMMLLPSKDIDNEYGALKE